MTKTKKKAEKAKKITNDELNKVQSIINNINRAQLEIGSFESKKHNMLHHVNSLQEELNKLQVIFKKNYGTDDINIQDGTINYKKEYVRDVKIQQLKKDVIFDLSFNFQGPLGLELVGDIVTPDQIAYTCLLEDAFPTTMNAIEFSNEGGLAELNVQLSYTTWQGVQGFSLSSLTGGLIPSIPALQGLG